MIPSPTMTSFRIALPAMLPFLFISVANANGDDDLNSRLARCTGIASDDARLACFDGLASELLQAETSPVDSGAPGSADIAAPAAESEPDEEQAAAVVPLTDDIGKEGIRRDESATPPEYAARLTRCERSSTGRYFFHFDNGQVWKQTSSGRIHFRDCEIDVTIMKDFFGFKMVVPGQRNRIRISRVR